MEQRLKRQLRTQTQTTYFGGGAFKLTGSPGYEIILSERERERAIQLDPISPNSYINILYTNESKSNLTWAPTA